MGKLTMYQCDSCYNNFKSSSEVVSISGCIFDGDDNIIYDGDSNTELLCKDCFFKKINSVKENCREPEKTKDKEIDKVEDLSNFTLLKKICNTRDEDEFINFIGHVSRESFNKVYNGNLIDHYYPIELDENEVINASEFNKLKNVNVINKVFASIPQVKNLKVIIHDQKDLALVNNISFTE